MRYTSAFLVTVGSLIKEQIVVAIAVGKSMNYPILCLKGSCMRLAGHTSGCDPYTMEAISNLPEEIKKKINKTAMTRGAQPYERVPYQNRVRRHNQAVIPFEFRNSRPIGGFQERYVIMVRPEEYFDPKTKTKEKTFPEDVVVGENAFIYYDNRKDWVAYPPKKYGLRPRIYIVEGVESDTKRKRKGVEEGHYLARVPATTSTGAAGEGIVEGIPQGIRFFEYASREETWKVMMQLSYLAWKTADIERLSGSQMKPHLASILLHHGLRNDEKLEETGVLRKGVTCCPLCTEPIRAEELTERFEQMKGREVTDLTVTEANLFHIKPLRPGEFNHRGYNVGWGHYHCNTTARDMGIEETLNWMEKILINTGRAKPSSFTNK